MRLLKSAARLTVDTDDYLCFSHSVQVNEDGSPVAENTQFNSFVLMPSIGKEGQVVEPLKLSLFGKKVAFYQLFPLYPEELEFKLEMTIWSNCSRRSLWSSISIARTIARNKRG